MKSLLNLFGSFPNDKKDTDKEQGNNSNEPNMHNYAKNRNDLNALLITHKLVLIKKLSIYIKINIIIVEINAIIMVFVY